MATLAPPAEPVYLEAGGTKILVVPRAQFVRRRWTYHPGEHVMFAGPTQDGKSTLAYQLQSVTISPQLPTLGLVMKPRDRVPASWSRHLGLIEVPHWPPPRPMPWREKPRGYTHWPRHSFNAKRDNKHLHSEFSQSLTWAYSRGNVIVFADETYGLLAELNLHDEVIAILTRGAGMGAGLWGGLQRTMGSPGHGMPGHIWSNAHHLFLGRDPDANSRKRYGEISGADPRVMAEVCSKLGKYEFLYVRKADQQGGPYYCIVTA